MAAPKGHEKYVKGQINEKKVTELARLRMSIKHIAWTIGCHPDTLAKSPWVELIHKGWAVPEKALYESLVRRGTGDTPDAKVMLFLAKHWLQMVDSPAGSVPIVLSESELNSKLKDALARSNAILEPKDSDPK